MARPETKFPPMAIVLAILVGLVLASLLAR